MVVQFNTKVCGDFVVLQYLKRLGTTGAGLRESEAAGIRVKGDTGKVVAAKVGRPSGYPHERDE